MTFLLFFFKKIGRAFTPALLLMVAGAQRVDDGGSLLRGGG